MQGFSTTPMGEIPHQLPLKILLVESNDEDANLLKVLLGRLQNPPFSLEIVSTLKEGIKYLETGSIDLVILNLFLTDSQGLGTFNVVNQKFPNVALVVFSTDHNEDLAIKVIQKGAHDYLVKESLDLTHMVRSMRIAYDSKQTKMALRAQEDQMQSVLNHSFDTIIAFDFNGIIFSLNPSGEKTFGYKAEEVIGKHISKLIPNPIANGNESNTSLEPLFPKINFAKSDQLVEFIGQHKNGNRISLEVSFNEIFQNDRKLLMGIFRDVTDRKLAQEKLIKAQNELIHAGKLAILGEMSAEISHELNQPLEAIQAYIDNINFLLEQKRYEDVQNNFEAVCDLTQRAGNIIDNIKNRLSDQSFVPESVSVQETLESTLSLLSLGNRLKDVVVKKNFPKEELITQANSLKLEQAFLNLITNALDAMDGEKNKILTLSLKSNNNEILLSFKDSGKGLSENELPHVFEPFFTTKNIKKGLGLGLSISSNIIKEFEGAIEVNNNSNRGAEFIVKLPLLPEPVKTT